MGVRECLFVCLFKLFYCCSITVFCIYSPTTPPSQPNPPPSLASTPHPPLWFCSCVLYSCSWKPFPPISPPSSPLVTVRLFLISMSLVIFCLLFSFADYVPVKGEIIWFLSLTTWLISFFKKYIYWLCYYSCPISHPPYSTPSCPPPPSHIPPL